MNTIDTSGSGLKLDLEKTELANQGEYKNFTGQPIISRRDIRAQSKEMDLVTKFYMKYKRLAIELLRENTWEDKGLLEGNYSKLDQKFNELNVRYREKANKHNSKTTRFWDIDPEQFGRFWENKFNTRQRVAFVMFQKRIDKILLDHGLQLTEINPKGLEQLVGNKDEDSAWTYYFYAALALAKDYYSLEEDKIDHQLIAESWHAKEHYNEACIKMVNRV